MAFTKRVGSPGYEEFMQSRRDREQFQRNRERNISGETVMTKKLSNPIEFFKLLKPNLFDELVTDQTFENQARALNSSYSVSAFCDEPTETGIDSDFPYDFLNNRKAFSPFLNIQDFPDKVGKVYYAFFEDIKHRVSFVKHFVDNLKKKGYTFENIEEYDNKYIARLSLYAYIFAQLTIPNFRKTIEPKDYDNISLRLRYYGSFILYGLTSILCQYALKDGFHILSNTKDLCKVFNEIYLVGSELLSQTLDENKNIIDGVLNGDISVNVEMKPFHPKEGSAFYESHKPSNEKTAANDSSESINQIKEMLDVTARMTREHLDVYKQLQRSCDYTQTLINNLFEQNKKLKDIQIDIFKDFVEMRKDFCNFDKKIDDRFNDLNKKLDEIEERERKERANKQQQVKKDDFTKQEKIIIGTSITAVICTVVISCCKIIVGAKPS